MLWRWCDGAKLGVGALGVNILVELLPVIILAEEDLPTSNFCEVVDASELEEGGHAIGEAHQEEPVQGRRIVNFGQVGPTVQTDCGEGEDGGDAQPDSVTGRLPVDPEAHPGEDHDKTAGEVDLDQEVARVPFHVEVHLEHGVVTFFPTDAQITIWVTYQVELGQCHAWHKAHAVVWLVPHVDYVLGRVSIYPAKPHSNDNHTNIHA